MIKPHRQIRQSKVSSETGVAVVTTDQAPPNRFETCLDGIEGLLKPFAPNERRSIISALIKRMSKGSEHND